jgi:hypothetical protein
MLYHGATTYTSLYVLYRGAIIYTAITYTVPWGFYMLRCGAITCMSMAVFQGKPLTREVPWEVELRSEIIPGKNSDTRIKPLPLNNGHGRYITVTTERTLVSVGKCPLNI